MCGIITKKSTPLIRVSITSTQTSRDYCSWHYWSLSAIFAFKICYVKVAITARFSSSYSMIFTIGLRTLFLMSFRYRSRNFPARALEEGMLGIVGCVRTVFARRRVVQTKNGEISVKRAIWPSASDRSPIHSVFGQARLRCSISGVLTICHC